MSYAISILVLVSTGILWLPIAAIYSALFSSISFLMILLKSLAELFGWNSENYVKGERFTDWVTSVFITTLKFLDDFVTVPTNVWNWSQENQIGSIIIILFFIYINLRFKPTLYALPIAFGFSFFVMIIAVSIIIPMFIISYATNVIVPFNQWDFSWVSKESFEKFPMFAFTCAAIFLVLFVLFKIFAFWTDKRVDRDERREIEFETGKRSYESLLRWRFIEVLFFLARVIAVIIGLVYVYSIVSGSV